MDQPGIHYASVGPRAAAALIDAVILGIVVGTPLTILFGHRYATSTATNHSVGYTSSNPLTFVLWLAIGILYFTIFEATKGATIGKLILHLRVRNVDGTVIDWKASALRNLVRVVDGIPFFIPYLVGAITAWGNTTHQRLGDKAAGTVVVLDIARSRTDF